jgi:membrane protein YdbS with pleckstrin-like domain
MAKRYEVKPNRTAFVNYRFAVRFIYSLIFFLILYFIINRFFSVSVLYFIIAFILLKLLSYYSLTVQYKKEKYVFLPNKIIRNGGGIFSEYEVELIVRNITHITMRLPFIENKLFQTGNISIESAGTGAAEVFLRSLDNSKQIYDYIEKLMKYNGFKLTKTNLIQQEQPSSVGVFFEVFKTFISTIFIVFFIGVYIGGGLIDLLMNNLSLVIPIVAVVLFLLFIRAIFQFLDLKNRVYDLYTDTITYSEGFLSKNYSFIPIENLSDSTLTQTLVDKIFGLYDVKISCQGSKQEIHFKNMVNGPKLEENIDKQISKAKSLVGTEKQQKVKQVQAKRQAAYKARPVSVDTRFTAEYRMDGKKTIVPLLIILPICLILFPLMLLWIIFLVTQIIRMSFTKYLVKSNSMEQRYNFITQKNAEFTNEKIMAVVFKESFIDKWFKTCSIHFWSIGSAENIKFTNIKKTPGLYESILAKSGIRNQEVLYQMNSNFKISEMFKSTLFITIISFFILIGSLFGTIIYSSLFLIPLGIIAFLYISIAIYKSIYYNRSKLTFYKDFIYFTRGIFFVEFYYALYDNVKDITTVKYPFSKLGSIKFNVAGEHIVQQGKNKSMVSNHFKINYIDDIDTKDELIDMIFYQRPNTQQIKQIEQNIQSYSPKPILSSKPDLANSLTGLIITSVIIFPLIALLPLTIPLTIWWVKVKSYSIQPYRVIAKSGILYKKQISIVFNKIDHINFSQGMLNKMFHNGNISVNTTGSSTPELIIGNIDNFKEFYDILKKYY